MKTGTLPMLPGGPTVAQYKAEQAAAIERLCDWLASWEPREGQTACVEGMWFIYRQKEWVEMEAER